MVSDKNAPTELFDTAFDLLNDDKKINELSENISKMALRDSAEKIVNEIAICLLSRSAAK